MSQVKNNKQYAFEYKVDVETVAQDTNCKYLGIYFNSKLRWKKQINYATRKTQNILQRTLKKKNSKSKEMTYISLGCH